ncbi:hypothetical protein SanaruYs_22040 [Chryseotalea sanaruensis]|uniref:Uncharacterized protein n=1 Tax=Chryseotalea sanaruensis TaxID=2482724 RepID=A0A401UAN9_9BACT|nr:hypothetical protein [Chryseotalea sanaruensis]GCC51973.1 hypothetical protein SanaruYs_22040 [Chryseotalea sanaruensis]
MKHYPNLLLLLLICCSSCNAEKGNSTSSVQEKPKLIYGRNYYWEKSDQDRFVAISFDSTDNIYCTLYSFGSKEEENEKRYLVKSTGVNIYELISLDSNRIHYEINITTNKSLVLSTTNQPLISYTTVIDDSFQKLFGKVKSKFQYKCISSDEIVFNGIVCYKTTVHEILSKPSYKKRIESYNDEIYGKGENNYLEYNGNRFYYGIETGREYFYKIEIVNNKMDSLYLGIKIGDKKSEVTKRLSVTSKPYKATRSEIVIRICNAKYEGGFGYLKLKFADLKDIDPILKSIDYNPYYDGE